MHYIRCCFFVAMVGAVPWVQAQVFKCAGPQGKTVYSDQPCGHTAQMLERERTFEEKIQERGQAYEAQLAKEDLRARDEARGRAAAERRAMQAATQAVMQPPETPHKGYAERLAERNAEVRSIFEQPKRRSKRGSPSYSPDTANPYSPAPTPTPAPSVMTHCAGGFCYDNMGGTYHQHGNGQTMTGPSGKTCVQTGSFVNCN